MKKHLLFPVVCLAIVVVFLSGHKSVSHYEVERSEMREDIMKLMNDMDSVGDMDRYCGSDHFERLHDFAYGED